MPSSQSRARVIFSQNRYRKAVLLWIHLEGLEDGVVSLEDLREQGCSVGILGIQRRGCVRYWGVTGDGVGEFLGYRIIF